MADDELCSGFEPQTYLKERCKKCFRLKSKHVPLQSAAAAATTTPAAPSASSGTPPLRPVERRMSWRDKVYGNAPGAPASPASPGASQTTTIPVTTYDADSAATNDSGADGAVSGGLSPQGSERRRGGARSPRSDDDSVSVVSFKSANSGGTRGRLSSAKSYESLTSNGDAKSMVTALSGGSDDERASTPTEQLDGGEIKMLQMQLELARDKISVLETEVEQLKRDGDQTRPRSRLDSSGSDSGNERLSMLDERLAYTESMCQDYRDENTVLKCELREIQESISKGGSTEAKQLKDKLTAAESLCEELMEENESLKADVKDLQQEIEEMQDQYREEEIEEFRDLQRELEQIAKNCRILQFKLRKAERARDQSDADRQHMEDKLKDLMSGGNGQVDISDSMRARELESELRIAKEVSVRLHNELEQTEDKRYKLEDENFYLKEKVRELETRAKLTEASRQKIHDIKRAPTGTAASQRGVTPPAADDANVNMAQLLRDLQDALERETDLRDQLKFAEDDIQSTHKKLQDLETENEGLLKQLAKLTTPGAGRGGRPPMTRSASEGQTQIQLELAEHEAAVLSSKLVKIEKENEQMVTKMSLLEKEVRKHGGKTEFSDDELSSAVPDTYYKQKIKLLEEELDDLKIRKEKEKARSTSDDQTAQSTAAWRFGNKRTRTPNANPPANRSRSLDQTSDEADKIMLDMKRQLAVSQQEIQMLQKRLAALEVTNEKLTEENKKLQILGRRRGSNGDLEKTEQMQKDIDRFMARIAELEAKTKEMDEKKSAPTLSAAQQSNGTGNGADLAKENKLLTTKLRDEKENLKKTEAQLLEMKQLMSKSDNQKLIQMASKVEVLSNQLKEATERSNALHKRATNGQQTDYMNALKERCDDLERQISVEKAQRIVSGAAPSSANANTAEEFEQCCEVLVTVEAQMDRIQKQLEKIDSTPKEESRRRSFSKENGTAIAAEMSKIKTELEALMAHLQQKKSDDVESSTAGGESSTSQLRAELRTTKEQLAKQEKASHDLREKLELVDTENSTSKQKCEDATARLLQTEERWNKELEKLKESYETQVRDLKYYLEESERQKKEKAAILAEKTSNLTEKTRAAAESEQKLSKLQEEMKTKYKDLQERTDVERRRAKEFETKYQKLEELYEVDRKKLSGEREKFKNDLLDLKKRYDETQSDLAKLRQTYTKKQESWGSEKATLEAELQRVKQEMTDLDKSVSKRASDVVSEETRRLVDETVQLKTKYDKEITSLKAQVDGLKSELKSKSTKVDSSKKDEERTKREADMLKSRVEEQKSQLEDTRRARDEAREELNKWQQSWARERSDLAHKLRQEEKVQQAETQALQLKFESRIKIMEDTNKNLHSQLAQARRERDQHRESLCTTEKKLTELKQGCETDEKRISDKLIMMEKTTEELKDLRTQVDRLTAENRLNKESFKTDKHVWSITKDQLLAKIATLEKDLTVTKRWTKPETAKDTENKIADAVKTAELVRKQGDEFKQFHEKEITKLTGLLEDTRNVNKKEMLELQRKIRELQENVKVLEIDRRNLLSTKDSYDTARSQLQSERDALLQRIHDTEIHQLANKYKLDKVADQMTDLQAKVRYSEATKSEKNAIEEFANAALRQLMAVREDMARTRELGKALDPLDESFDRVSERSLPVSERMGPVGSESEPSTTPEMRSLRKVSKSPLTIQRKLTATPENRSPKPEEKIAYTPMKTAYSNAKIRSYSTETASNWEAKIAELRVLRSPSPSPKKLTAYPEAPPSFILNKDKVVEYDKEGKRHYIPKAMTRSISYEPSSNKPLGATECEVDSSDDVESTKSHSRTSSTGTNVLYQIRREELASGNAPSVKRMADAFNQIQKSGSNVATKRSIFGVRKSRSVETTDTGRHIGQIGRSVLPPGVSPAALPDSLQSSTESNLHLQHEESPFQRARNPLKGIGSRFVDHVRRSLSRGRRSASKEKEPKEPKKVSIKITKKSTKESAEKSLGTGASSSGTSIGSTIPTNTGVDSEKLYQSLVEVYGPHRPAMKRYDSARRSLSARLPLFQDRYS